MYSKKDLEIDLKVKKEVVVQRFDEMNPMNLKIIVVHVYELYYALVNKLENFVLDTKIIKNNKMEF